MEKSGTFRSLRITASVVFGLLVTAILCQGCWFNANMQTRGTAFIQGIWQQDAVPNQKQLISYSLYHLNFSCDSFYVSIHTFSKVDAGADSCMKPGNWTEYCRGTYEQRSDTLFLNGQFCNSDFTIKDDKGCYRSGDYKEYFKITKLTDSLLRLQSTTSVIPITARLIKRTSCHPKPI